jgi:hypothetical protein
VTTGRRWAVELTRRVTFARKLECRVNQELELARELLADARFLLAEGRHRSTASRAYCSAYHAVVALAEYGGLRPADYLGRGGQRAHRWEHGIVTVIVAADQRLSRVVGRSVGRQVRWLYQQRLRGDYQPDRPTSALAAQTSVSLAEQLFRGVEGYVYAQRS